MPMFRDGCIFRGGKISVGNLLEIHKLTWPIACAFSWLKSTCACGSESTRMATMTGLYSAYGVLWVLKSNTFYDIKFYLPQNYQSVTTAIINYASISVYYLFPYLASRNCSPLTNLDLALSLFLYVVGGFLHYCADAQKFYTLKYNPNSLIVEGLFEHLQHPNYLGEFLMWLALAIVAGKYNVWSYIPVAWLFMGTIIVGMPLKEKSMKRYDNYETWTKKTYRLIPFIW